MPKATGPIGPDDRDHLPYRTVRGRIQPERVDVAAGVGNPGLHLATIVAEFIEMISDSGAGLYGCQASCDLFGITKDDLIEQVQGIITVGEFYAMAAGGQIIFT